MLRSVCVAWPSLRLDRGHRRSRSGHDADFAPTPFGLRRFARGLSAASVHILYFPMVTVAAISQSLCVTTICCTSAASRRAKARKPDTGGRARRRASELFPHTCGESRGQDLNLRPSGYEEAPGALSSRGSGWQPVADSGVPRHRISTRSPQITPFRSSHGAAVGLSPAQDGDAFLTVAEVAARLKVSKATVYKLIESGELGHCRVRNSIRISEATLSGKGLRADTAHRNALPCPVASKELKPEQTTARFALDFLDMED